MKNILILFMLMISINLLGQKPKNKQYGIIYNDDMSISFESFHGLEGSNNVSSSHLPELLAIFETADKLLNLLKDKTIIIEKSIGIVNSYEFKMTGSSIYVYENNRLLTIIGKSNNYHEEGFVPLLTTIRDKYYSDLTKYNKELAEVNADADVIISESAINTKHEQLEYRHNTPKPIVQPEFYYNPEDSPAKYEYNYIGEMYANHIQFNDDHTMSFKYNKRTILTYSLSDIENLRQLLSSVDKIHDNAVSNNITTDFTKSLGTINGVEYVFKYNKYFSYVGANIRNFHCGVYEMKNGEEGFNGISFGDNKNINNIFEGYDFYYKALSQFNEQLKRNELKEQKDKEIINKL